MCKGFRQDDKGPLGLRETQEWKRQLWGDCISARSSEETMTWRGLLMYIWGQNMGELWGRWQTSLGNLRKSMELWGTYSEQKN